MPATYDRSQSERRIADDGLRRVLARETICRAVGKGDEDVRGRVERRRLAHVAMIVVSSDVAGDLELAPEVIYFFFESPFELARILRCDYDLDRDAGRR